VFMCTWVRRPKGAAGLGFRVQGKSVELCCRTRTHAVLVRLPNEMSFGQRRRYNVAGRLLFLNRGIEG
jgi:hypothetical protein